MAGDEPASIIGGAEIFDLFLPHADRLELTEVQGEIAGDRVSVTESMTRQGVLGVGPSRATQVPASEETGDCPVVMPPRLSGVAGLEGDATEKALRLCRLVVVAHSTGQGEGFLRGLAGFVESAVEDGDHRGEP